MKQIIFCCAIAISLFSCEKGGLFDREKPCPVVVAESVPAAVKESFIAKYPGTAVTTWFNKDNNGYCALFTSNGNETRAFFDNNGNFQNDEVEGDNNDGDHQDNNDDGCECETEDGD